MAEGLYRGIVRNYVVSLCILLVLVGDIVFLYAIGDTPNKLAANLEMLGETLFQAGAIALILETINLKRWAREEVVTSLTSSPDYLRKMSPDALTEQMRLVATARFKHDPGVDGAVEWLTTMLSAPARSDYSVELTPCRDVLSEPFEQDFPLAASVLPLESRISYSTAPNLSRKPLPINGSGIIHSFFALVPHDTELTRRYRAGQLTFQQQMRWIEEMITPTLQVEVPGHEREHINPEIRNVVLSESLHGKVSMRFDLYCSLQLHPQEKARIVYTHRQLAETHDAYVWHASARTTDLTFRMLNFDDYTLVPVFGPTSRSTIGLYSNEIRLHGLIPPETTFAFAWSPRAVRPAEAPR
ncbi:hypothetical protein [Nonomuraea soli]|uniref:Uncharacterized protein n=1 Tax=Nonomuraea soli TaxID=1032476 RepID=A0A7W0CLS2_9ACTN|nr:hypothetical protein [Nonomuraea soli]MBA2893446.1 hypothetical protein [Nonomuraea soli]